MEVTKREVYLFPKPGAVNTDMVVEAIVKRMEAGDLGTVVVASNSGRTAVTIGRALQGKARVLCVTEAPSRRQWDQAWPTLRDDSRRDLRELGMDIVENAPFAFHESILDESRWDVPSAAELVKETLYAFGQGLKVAVEVVLMAVASGHLEPYQDVIGVGGTGSGVDTAVVVRATYPASFFAKDPEKRLEVREIIAMPLSKKWWD